MDIVALTLTRVATLAVRAVPGADGAAVMLGKAADQDGMQARAASARFVREIEAIQNSMLHEGAQYHRGGPGSVPGPQGSACTARLACR